MWKFVPNAFGIENVGIREFGLPRRHHEELKLWGKGGCNIFFENVACVIKILTYFYMA
jgi:hypothetical protein